MDTVCLGPAPVPAIRSSEFLAFHSITVTAIPSSSAAIAVKDTQSMENKATITANNDLTLDFRLKMNFIQLILQDFGPKIKQGTPAPRFPKTITIIR
jgi:hypothetical protein